MILTEYFITFTNIKVLAEIIKEEFPVFQGIIEDYWFKNAVPNGAPKNVDFTEICKYLGKNMLTHLLEDDE